MSPAQTFEGPFGFETRSGHPEAEDVTVSAILALQRVEQSDESVLASR